jgi:hypothetical protein
MKAHSVARADASFVNNAKSEESRLSNTLSPQSAEASFGRCQKTFYHFLL